MVGLIVGLVVGLILLSWGWVEGIDRIDKDHPDYKGEEFLNWDDNKNHTEGDFH